MVNRRQPFRVGQKVKIRSIEDMKHVGGQIGLDYRYLGDRVFIVKAVREFKEGIVELEGFDRDGFLHGDLFLLWVVKQRNLSDKNLLDK